MHSYHTYGNTKSSPHQNPFIVKLRRVLVVLFMEFSMCRRERCELVNRIKRRRVVYVCIYAAVTSIYSVPSYCVNAKCSFALSFHATNLTSKTHNRKIHKTYICISTICCACFVSFFTTYSYNTMYVPNNYIVCRSLIQYKTCSAQANKVV